VRSVGDIEKHRQQLLEKLYDVDGLLLRLLPEDLPAPSATVAAVATEANPDALAALKAAKNPCVTIEKWLRQAKPDQVSQIWSLVDEMLATGKGGRK
jgi:hypothetical protein